ncbi:RHS repeat-associated core domain-containing protein [Pseudomonas alliivorans]|nr:RHS repeat-associated core domain-containing protein [Pseudomonas alliivorans]MEE4903774.1 RHS repeat-associated core domain-containing protein [Pseudomonas alliivorans]MEE4999740.1 RHS repeat-associated core domain-containing protein [Pseudomonas alliivorans]
MTLLCTYTYDPLDRIATLSPLAQALTQRFYCNGRMTTERQGDLMRTLFQADTHLLAQLNREGNDSAVDLIVTDTQNSALGVTTAAQQIDIAYSPYGHRDPDLLGTALPGFTGAQPERVTGHYLLGNGYRAFNPTLMRFNSPDNLSPFGKGGWNAYAYCAGNPVNRIDPTGHVDFSIPVTALGLLSVFAGAATLIAGAFTQSSNPELSGKLLTAGAVLGGSGLALLGGVTATRRIGARKKTLTSPSVSSPGSKHRPGFSGRGGDDSYSNLIKRIENLEDKRAISAIKLQRLDQHALEDPAYLSRRLPTVAGLERIAFAIPLPPDTTFDEMRLLLSHGNFPMRSIRESGA